jgi:hypothetical protein
MTEFSMRVSSVQFRVLDHTLHSLIGATGSSVVDVDGLKLNVEGRFVGGIKAYDVPTDLIDLALFGLF